MCARVFMKQVVHVAGRHERQPGALGELREERVDPCLLGEARILDLDVRAVFAKDLHQLVQVGRRVALARLLERLRDPPRQASGERDHACRMLLEQRPVDARLVVIPLQIAG